MGDVAYFLNWRGKVQSGRSSFGSRVYYTLYQLWEAHMNKKSAIHSFFSPIFSNSDKMFQLKKCRISFGLRSNGIQFYVPPFDAIILIAPLLKRLE